MSALWIGETCLPEDKASGDMSPHSKAAAQKAQLLCHLEAKGNRNGYVACDQEDPIRIQLGASRIAPERMQALAG